MQWQYAIGPSILFDMGAELPQLGSNDRLEVCDLALREERGGGIAQAAVMLMQRRSKEGVVGAEPGGEWSVLVKFARLDV